MLINPMVMRPPGFSTSNQPEARVHVVHMLGHVPGVNLIRAIRFETRQGRNILVTIRSHLAIAVDIHVTFLVENLAAEVKFHLPR
jgi:hypothetical protein